MGGGGGGCVCVGGGALFVQCIPVCPYISVFLCGHLSVVCTHTRVVWLQLLSSSITLPFNEKRKLLPLCQR